MPTSPRASLIGLPTVRASRRASSSARAAIEEAMRRIRLDRSLGASAFHAGYAAFARATAWSASSTVACWSSASTCSVAGSITLSVPVLVAISPPCMADDKWANMGSIAMIVSVYGSRNERSKMLEGLGGMAGAREAVIVSQSTRVLPLEFGRRYPVVVRGEGVWVEDASGKRSLDAMSGGSMAATLGHGRRDIIASARAQAEKLAYVHNERLTNPPQEKLAHELAGVAPKGFTRVRFVTGGAEANEMAMQIARQYHVDRGDTKRWQIISPAQSYHGPTMATLA